MSADLLRRAADVMDQFRYAAPLEFEASSTLWSAITDYADDDSDVNRARISEALIRYEDAIIAGNVPLSGIATWLRRAAAFWAIPAIAEQGRPRDLDLALAVARAYLGESA